MEVLILAFVAVVLGAVFRTIYDFLWKVVDNPDLAFDSKFWVTMLVSILITMLSMPMFFLNVTVPSGSDFFIFITMAAVGFTANHVVNKPVSLGIKKVAEINKLAEAEKSEPSN